MRPGGRRISRIYYRTPPPASGYLAYRPGFSGYGRRRRTLPRYDCWYRVVLEMGRRTRVAGNPLRIEICHPLRTHPLKQARYIPGNFAGNAFAVDFTGDFPGNSGDSLGDHPRSRRIPHGIPLWVTRGFPRSEFHRETAASSKKVGADRGAVGKWSLGPILITKSIIARARNIVDADAESLDIDNQVCDRPAGCVWARCDLARDALSRTPRQRAPGAPTHRITGRANSYVLIL